MHADSCLIMGDVACREEPSAELASLAEARRIRHARVPRRPGLVGRIIDPFSLCSKRLRPLSPALLVQARYHTSIPVLALLSVIC